MTFAFAGVVPFLSESALVGIFQDDAFYYFQIARNLAHGHGFTFDGLHRTNGFHPLWLFVVTPIFRFIGGDLLPLRIIAFLQAGLVAGAAVQIFRVLQARIIFPAALLGAVAIVALPDTPKIFCCGLETSLLVFLVTTVWQRWLALSDRPAARDWLTLGTLCALAWLTRLEAILMVPLLLWLARNFFTNVRAALLFVAPTVVGLVAYVAWNTSAFHTLLPISGMVKSHLIAVMPLGTRLLGELEVPWLAQQLICHAARGGDSVYQLGTLAVVAYFVSTALLLAGAWHFRAWLRARCIDTGATFLLGTASLLLALDKAVLVYIRPWERGLLEIATAVIGAAIFARHRKLATWALVPVVLFGVYRPLRFAAASKMPQQETSWGANMAHLGHWLEANTDAYAIIGSWNAGIVGYFSHRTVIDLDGLANDVAYFREAIEARKVVDYWRRENIGWVADTVCDARQLAHAGIYAGAMNIDVLASHLELVFRTPAPRNVVCSPGVWRVRSLHDGG